MKIKKAILIAALVSAGLLAAGTKFFTDMPKPFSAADEPPDKFAANSHIYENNTDPTQFLATEYAAKNGLTREDIISFNEFRLADGSPLRVIFLKRKPGEDSPRLITMDKQWNWREIDTYGKPYAFAGFDGNFSLQPEDYNNDGYPDFLVKARAPDKNGCLYDLHCTGIHSYCNYIYIYGETADAPRLDRIDRNNFFLFTLDEYGFPKPQVYNDAEHLAFIDIYSPFYDIDKFENNGWIFASSYENGVITLKGTAAVMYRTGKNTHMDIAVKMPDSLTGESADVLVCSADLTADYSHRTSSVIIRKELPPGVYGIDVTVNGKTTFTEFYVY